jgi:hypothetical protein
VAYTVPPVFWGCSIAKAVHPWQHGSHAFYTGTLGVNLRRSKMSEKFGTCQCGEVGYTVRGSIVQVVNCHCGLCRRTTGAPFSSYVVIREANFAVIRGQGSLGSFAVTKRTTKRFCKTCGTPIFNSNPEMYPSLVMLYLGTLNGHEELTPAIDIFCEKRLQWVSTNESSKTFPHAPGGNPR